MFIYLLKKKKKKNHNASSYDKCVLEKFLNATFGVLIPIKANRLKGGIRGDCV